MRFGARVLRRIRPSVAYVMCFTGMTGAGYAALCLNIIPLSYLPTDVQLSKPYNIYNAGSPELCLYIKTVPYGVLGTQMTTDKRFIQSGTEPEGSAIVIVDPAGLHHIQGLPAGAGGAAGSIYKWLGIDLNEPFDKSIQKKIKKPTDAARFVYADGTKAVIHAVGPDLRNYSDVWEVKRALTTTYINIFKEFAEHVRPELDIFRPDDLNLNAREPWGTLRILPVSGGIFSGDFKSEMPTLTVECMTAALGQLPKIYRRSLAMRTKSIELCIFDENELQAFTSILAEVKDRKTTIDYDVASATSARKTLPSNIQNILDQNDADVPGYIPPSNSGSA